MEEEENSSSSSVDSDEELDEDVNDSSDEKRTSDGEEEEEHLRQELLDVPLGQLQALREKVGMKKFDSAMKAGPTERVPRKKKFTRDNKNKPREMTSRRPVSRFRHVVSVKKQKARDPRFGQKSGKFHEPMFKKAYSFLDDVKEKEKKMAEKELKKTRNPERKTQLHRLLQKMESERLAEKVKEEKRAAEKERRKTERLLQQREGKKPFFLKKSVRKRLELAEKYKQLKENGMLDKYLAKKRKRNAQRDRRQLPFTRH